jgi:hypothetical protein
MNMVGVRKHHHQRRHMHVQAPTLTIPHRTQVLSALAALAVAGGAYGAITIATNDDGATKSSQPAVVTKSDSRVLDGSAILRGTANRVDPSRVLDGSAILRGTANRVDPSRVLDGSPLLRGGVEAPTVVNVPHPRLDGGPFVTKSSNAKPTTVQPPMRRPEGFHSR